MELNIGGVQMTKSGGYWFVPCATCSQVDLDDQATSPTFRYVSCAEEVNGCELQLGMSNGICK